MSAVVSFCLITHGKDWGYMIDLFDWFFCIHVKSFLYESQSNQIQLLLG